MAVVVGYLPTPEGRAALAMGVDEAIRRTADLVVVSSRPARPEDDAELARDLEEHRPALTEAGIEPQTRRLPEEGDTAEDILAIAEDVRAGVIVIGLRRRSPVGKLLLGSNAQRILLDAPCPVLAVKAGEGS